MEVFLTFTMFSCFYIPGRLSLKSLPGKCLNLFLHSVIGNAVYDDNIHVAREGSAL